MDPHRLVRAYCPEDQLDTKIEDNPFVVHHYLETREQDSFREDALRKQIEQGNQSRKSYDVNDGQDDTIRPWLDGFVEDRGLDVASKLLQGVGDVNYSNESVEPEGEFSACLLVMDDNHFLIEWLAYHYHTLPLRHLILAVDPRSVTSPTKILDRWRDHGMVIEEWSDKDFMPPVRNVSNMKNAQMISLLSRKGYNTEDAQVISLHRTRQKQFYNKCLRVLKSAGRTWTLLIDTDEYLVINQRATSRFHVPAPSPEKPGSIMSFLRQELAKNETELPKDSPCIMIPRLRFGCAKSHLEQVNRDVPIGFNGSAFQTLHCRKHAPPKISDINKTGKTIIDISRVETKKISVMNPHRPLWAYCPDSELYTEIKDNLFVVHHYAGTWEQYSFREDYRNMKSIKVRQYSFSNFEVRMMRFLTSAFGFSPSSNT
jgi:hypothetical protein